MRTQELGQKIDITFEEVADAIKVVKTILTFYVELVGWEVLSLLSVLQVIEEVRGLQPICEMPEAIKQDIQNVVPSTQRESGPVAQAVVEEIEDSPRK